MKLSSALIMAGVTALGLSGHANAGDGACLWLGLPQNYRDAFMTNFPSEGQKAFARLAAPPEIMGAIMAKCGVTTLVQNHAAVGALIAYGWEQGESHVMVAKYGITSTTVDAAWMALAPSRRETFEASVMKGADVGMPASSSDPKDRDAALSVLSELTKSMAVSDNAEIDLIGHYLTWKVARPHYEARF